jgi:gluconate 5-dehydrogenase
MIDPFNFTDTTALVIGGGSGIGREISRALCDRGAQVIIAGRTEAKLDRVVAELRSSEEVCCTGVAVDVTSESSVSTLMRQVDEIFPTGLNILVNSAGINIRSPLNQTRLEDFRAVIDANLTGTFLTTQAAYSRLKKAEFGRVINLASIFSTVSYPHRVNYASSKGGVLMLTKTLAVEWAQEGITVNAISPGPLLTEINQKVLDDPENYAKFCERIPMRRFGQPEEVITSALFLASRYSSYVTGADIRVDGGWTSA